MIFRIVALWLILLPAASFADTLKGHIVDPQGRRVVNAQVRLSDRTTGELRETRSSQEGDYAFTQIASGDYLIEAEASSLKASRAVNVRGDSNPDVELTITASP